MLSLTIPGHLPTGDPDSTAVPPRGDSRVAVRWWLFICCFMLLAMVMVGGATRLTHSGLSIVQWQPLLGTLPPWTAADWQQRFDEYRASPEFRLVNPDMDLAAFKGIFWWEYGHRLLGRIIGLTVALPLAVLALRRRLPAPTVRALLIALALGAIQGFIGWYMVSSGLVDEPRVSPLRLMLHLGCAVLIVGLLLWTALDLLPRRTASDADAQWVARLSRAASALIVLEFVMMLSGALVAGNHAGLIFNSFPFMGDSLIPGGLMALHPGWRNFYENLVTVQFDHRAIAWVLIVLVPGLFLTVRRTMQDRAVRNAAALLLGALLVQVSLGVATLLGHVPLGLAVMHQGCAVLLFCAAVNLRHALRGVAAVLP